MKTMKALVLLSLIFCLVFVSACSSAAKTPAATDTSAATATPAATVQATEAPPATVAPEEDVTIKYARWASGDEEKNFSLWIGQFTASHPHIKVETELLPWAAYWEKVKTDLISGSPADVLSFNYSSWIPYTRSDVFVDLNTFPDSKDVLAQMSPPAVQGFIIDGKQLGSPIGIGRRIPFINKDLFAQANVPLPSQTVPMTSAQFVDMLKKLQAGIKDKGFVAADFIYEELLTNLAMSGGSAIFSPDGKKVMINNPAGIKALDALQEIMTSGAVVPYAQSWTGAFGGPDDVIKSKKVALGWTGNWSLQGYQAAGIKYMSIPAPVLEGAPANPPVDGYYNGISITKASKHQKAAWELVKFLLSKEGQIGFGKFSDAPANLEAQKANDDYFKAKDNDAFGGFVSSEANVLTDYATPADFTTLLSKLMTDLSTKKITGAQFADKLEKDGQPLLDKFQANIGK